MANGFFSRHPKNTSSELADPTPVEAVAPAPHTKLDDALGDWKNQLARLTRIDGEDAPRLTMNQPHPGGLAQLYTDHPTRLSLLLREPTSHQRAVERARTIIARSHELTARHGVGIIHMAIGHARWFEAGRAQSSAALLRTARLSENGADITITLLPGYALDPLLASALARRGVHIEAEDLVARASTQHGFSSSRALSELRVSASVLERFELRDELVLGIFEHPASELQREYEHSEHLLASPIVRALAGEEEARTQTLKPLKASDPKDRDPWRERGAGDLTPRQLDVVEAVAEGRSLVVDVPHGADDTALVGAILADAAASGRQTIHIGGSPSRTTRAEDRLRELGLAEVATRIDGTTASGEELRALLRSALSDTTSVTDPREVDEMRTRLRDVREGLSSYTSSLHRPFGVFGVSAYNALQVLTDLTAAHPAPKTRVRLREEILLAIAADQGAYARELLHKAAALGIFSRSAAHTAWKGVVIGSEEQVPDVLERIHRLAKDTLPKLHQQMRAVAAEADIAEATTLSEWRDQLAMFEGVRDVLDIFLPQVFERSAADMVIATAPKQWRTAHGISMKRSERVRLVKRAQDFVRPGTHIEDLHSALITVQEHREAWRAYAADEGWPILPQRLDETRELTESVLADLKALAPAFSTVHRDFTSMSIEDLTNRLEALDADPKGARELPKRVEVLKHLSEAGLSALVNDLRERHVKTKLIDSELDLAWWASILGLMLASEPELGGYDPAHLEEALAAGRSLDALQVQSLAPQALDQLRRLRLQAMATRPDQKTTIAQLCSSFDSALEVLTSVPLVRLLVPVVFTVPTLVPKIVRPGHHVDLLILDDIDGLPLAELVPIIARARQVVVLADLSAGSEEGASTILTTVLPKTRMDVTPTRLNDQVALLLARHGVDHTGVPVPWTAASAPVTAVWCEGTGMPAPGSHAIESTSAEVNAVVELVVAHAVEQPERSLAVIALNARHAERIRHAIMRTRASEPGLGDFFDATSAQPFLVVDPAEARGLARDCIIVAVGFAKTPHGRVVHDFGEFSTPEGVKVMSDVLRSVRGDLILVSSIRASEIDRSRLKAEGAHMLVELLEIAEGQSGVGSGAWPVLEVEPDRLLVDLADRLYGMGLEVVPNIGIPGGMRIPLAIGHPEVPGRLLVAILTDDDAYVAEPSLRVRDRMWPAMLEAQGWKVHTALSMAVFIDPAKEADTIVELVLDAVDEINGPFVPSTQVPDSIDFESDSEYFLEGANGDEFAGKSSAALGVGDPGLEDGAVGEAAEYSAAWNAEEGTGETALDELVAATSDARERADVFNTGMLEVITQQAPPSNRGPRPAIASGLPLAAYSDDQLDEMAQWVRSDGIERSREETVEELREALGITRRGFQSDAVLGNVVRRTEAAATLAGESGDEAGAADSAERAEE